MNKGDRGAWGSNTDKHSDSDETVLLSTPPHTSTWRRQKSATDVWFHQFTDDKFGKRHNMMPHVDKDTNQDNVILYFAAVVTLLFKIIWYCQHYLYIQTVGFLQYMT